MSINVLIADDSDLMRTAIRRALNAEPRIKVLGEASSFASTMQMIADLKPDVLLLDLHLAEERDFTPAFVKSQLVSVDHTVAISFSERYRGAGLGQGLWRRHSTRQDAPL